MKTLTVALFASLSLNTAVNAEECVKQVFNEYCLGGRIETALERHTPVSDFTTRGKRLTAFGTPTNGYLLGSHAGKIMTVSKIQQNPAYEDYSALLRKLTELYGESKTRKKLPSYAEDPNSIEIAMRAGRGTIVHIWDQGEWDAALIWGRAGLSLRYTDHAAEKEYQTANPNPDGL